MARIDFYQLSRDPVEQVVPSLARKALASGARLAVVHRDTDMRRRLSDALWAAEECFLAHGEAEGDHAARQPILLSGEGDLANGATIAVLADGDIRSAAEQFDRVLLLFGAERTDAARDLWRRLGTAAGGGTSAHELHIFKQGPDGTWREGR
ncbi:DNA polymerase III subunit chi [Qipengyuania sp. MTN3-11]|uniref:DNA polymerase III subunit chi n=1 Tax=Qipengyuania sp. MTN3-11 TaxID=3056557 RepID=UPI0036F3CDC3